MNIPANASLCFMLLNITTIACYCIATSLFKLSYTINESMVFCCIKMLMISYLLCISCMVRTTNNIIINKHINTLLSYVSLLGILQIAISPIINSDIITFKNYIPISENVAYILGISTVFVSVLIHCIYSSFTNYQHIKYILRNLTSGKIKLTNDDLLCIGVFEIWIFFIILSVCFIASYYNTSIVIKVVDISIYMYYNLLLLSVDSLLKISFLQVLIVWIMSIDITINNKRLYLSLFIIQIIIAFIYLCGNFLYDINSYHFYELNFSLNYYLICIITLLLMLIIINLYKDISKLTIICKKYDLLCFFTIFLLSLVL